MLSTLEVEELSCGQKSPAFAWSIHSLAAFPGAGGLVKLPSCPCTVVVSQESKSTSVSPWWY